jgi:outer membrane protein, heavy metal efflux system
VKKRLNPLSLWLALSVSGCVSSGAGYDLARQTVRERSGLEVPADEGDAQLNAELLKKPLTADSAARLALANSPAVQKTLSSVGVARADLVRSLRLPNPEGHFAANFEDSGRVDLELAATIDIVQLALVPGRQAAASEALDASALDAAGALIEIACAARVAFYEYQAATQSLELRKTVAYAAAQSSAIAAKLLEAGNTPELPALTEQVLYEEARIGVAQAEIAATVARERLNAVLGLSGLEAASWQTGARLPEPDDFDSSNLERRAISSSLELQALKKRYGAASIESDLAWAAGALPGISGGVGVEREEDEWGVGPRVNVTLPLFYQGQGEAAAAEAHMTMAKSAHADAAIRTRSVARSLGTQLAGVRQSAVFYQKTLLPLRQKIVDETLRQYNAMSTGPLQVLQAKRDQVDAARTYVDLLRDYWVTRAQIEMLLAGRAPNTPASLTPRASVESSGGAGH